MAETEEVLFSVENHIGIITLNRPNALNALNFPMFKAMLATLEAWKVDENVHAVVIQAAPGRAFCAGGDVRWVYEVGQNSPETALQLFECEYRLDYLTSDFGKPYIALMDGLTIGGGVGVTLHGSHAVASERFAFTMPEASIGFFPDIGSSHLLSACPGGFGVYLGLTGRRVNAADSKTLGFVKYTVPSEKFPVILQDLFAADLSSEADEKVSECLRQYQEDMPAGSAAEEADEVSRVFEGKQALREVFDVINAVESPFTSGLLDDLSQQSPFSLHVTLEQLNRAKGLSLADCLRMDYGLTHHFLRDHDFYEGVRARLVDKDKLPKWRPSTWESVSQEQVLGYFEKTAEPLSLG